MSDKNTKKTKKLNKENKVVENKSSNDIKQDFLNLNFEPYQIANSNESKGITSIFGKEVDLVNKYLRFLFDNRLDVPNLKTNVPNLYAYILNLKKDMRNAINVPRILKTFSYNIQVLDKTDISGNS